MKKSVKIDFVDFWEGFDKRNNFLWNVLSEHFNLIISDKPDYLIYSNYGTKFYFYKCIRIFYSRENVRPDFTVCDFAITSDWRKEKNHYTFPVFGSRYSKGELLSAPSTDEVEAFKKRSKFCCLVISNGKAKKRLDFFNKLSASYKQVDSGGRFANNIGYPVEDKAAFISNYKFIIAFENSSYPGYTTEKLYDALVAGCIPIYWGDPLVNRYFNPKRFINYSDYKSEDDLIAKIKEIDENEELAKDIIMQPCFVNYAVPYNVESSNLVNFFQSIFNTKISSPVAFSKRKKLHHLLKSSTKGYIKKYFNYPADFR